MSPHTKAAMLAGAILLGMLAWMVLALLYAPEPAVVQR
jgi:hypothetical protein